MAENQWVCREITLIIGFYIGFTTPLTTGIYNW